MTLGPVAKLEAGAAASAAAWTGLVWVRVVVWEIAGAAEAGICAGSDEAGLLGCAARTGMPVGEGTGLATGASVLGTTATGFSGVTGATAGAGGGEETMINFGSAMEEATAGEAVGWIRTFS